MFLIIFVYSVIKQFECWKRYKRYKTQKLKTAAGFAAKPFLSVIIKLELIYPKLEQ